MLAITVIFHINCYLSMLPYSVVGVNDNIWMLNRTHAVFHLDNPPLLYIVPVVSHCVCAIICALTISLFLQKSIYGKWYGMKDPPDTFTAHDVGVYNDMQLPHIFLFTKDKL